MIEGYNLEHVCWLLFAYILFIAQSSMANRVLKWTSDTKTAIG